MDIIIELEIETDGYDIGPLDTLYEDIDEALRNGATKIIIKVKRHE